MKGKKLSTSVLAAIMLAGSTAAPAFAAIPDATVVFGDKAFSMDYIADDNNTAAIAEIVMGLGDDEKIFVKLNDDWFDAMTTETITDLTVIPAVTYVSAEGEKNYEAGDGDEATEGFVIEEVSAASTKTIKVVFSEEVDTEKASFEVKRGKRIKTLDDEKLSWNEEKTEATLTLANHTIIKGEYSVKVNGLDLEENMMSFTAENERVDTVEIVGEMTPLVDDNKVAVTIKVLNQYGDNTTATNHVQVVTNFGNMEITKTGTYEFTVGAEIVKNVNNGLFEDFEYTVNAIDVTTGMSDRAELKVVKEAVPTTVELENVYVEKTEKDKTFMAVADKIVEKDAKQTIYVKIELEDQYGNVMNRDTFKTVAALEALLAKGTYSLSTIVSGDTGYAFSADEKDKAVYLKLDKTYANHLVDETIYFMLGGKVEKKTIDIAEKRTSDEIEITLPELIVKGEKIEITEFEARDKNGDAYVGKDLAALLNTEGVFDTNDHGVFKASYDKKADKVTLVWDLTGEENQTKEAITIITVKSGTDIGTLTARIKPAAKAVDARLDNSKIRKMLKGTQSTLKLSEMVVFDQYDRKMAPAQVINTILVNGNPAQSVVKDGKIVDGTWTISANAKENVLDEYEITIKDNTKFEGSVARFKTVKESEVVKLVVTAPESIFGESDDVKYGKEFSVIGETASGEKVALKASHYGVTTSNVKFVGGKVVSNFTSNFADNKDKLGSIVVVPFLQDSVAQTVVKTINLECENPVRTNVAVRENKLTVSLADKATLTGADLLAMLKVTDQYGLEESYANEANMIVVRGKVTVTNQGTKNIVVAGYKAGSTFEVEVYYTNTPVKFTVTIAE